MVKIVLKDLFPTDFPIIPNDTEIKNGASIPTYNLLRKFIDDPENSDKDFYFILGSDLLAGIRKWDNGEELVNEMNFIIFIRIGYVVAPEVLPKNYIIVNTTFVASSSTEIRNRVKNFCKKHHNHKKLIRRPTMPKAYSFVMDTSFANMPELELTLQERTIDQEEIDVDDTRLGMEERYMGILGIVPLSIIDYIKTNHLYCDDHERRTQEHETPKKKVQMPSKSKSQTKEVAETILEERDEADKENVETNLVN
eukprot:CAMPEP_0176457012 /NCGR_PEP_ID=MMETSP0127-20121128/31654_1 /TAXON_ID=938130 /ORGANISM="Platyophrya macrostoma, Strain WH" /LENGTH=252 /DNA_ID=CAMNT_0017847129 /DNA_START=185 /DNA_END=943 /DNA_ORIENTATION=-